MIHFDKYILIIVMEQIPGDTRALRHPIQPEAPDSSIDSIVVDLDVDSAMEFDARHLRTRELAAHVNFMDRVVSDGAECGTQAADDARLPTVRNGVVADDVVADVF